MTSEILKSFFSQDQDNNDKDKTYLNKKNGWEETKQDYDSVSTKLEHNRLC